MSFKKNKIKGISFHHRSSRESSRRTSQQKSKLQDFFNLETLFEQIKKESPQSFTSLDIRRFLGDHGRNEINSQISRCIDFSTKWTGILKVVERCFPDKGFLSEENFCVQDSRFQSEIEIYLLIKRMIWLWKHNLNILEMTAQAQYSVLKLRNGGRLKIDLV